MSGENLLKMILNLMLVSCIFCTVSACIENTQVKDSGIVKALSCGPNASDFPTATVQLNQAESCAVMQCKIVDAETKEVAGFTNSDWLYNGPNKTFTVAELNSFRTLAKSRALSTVPVGKSLIKITYTSNAAVSTSISQWFLSATAQYGICSRTSSQSIN